MSGKTIVEIKNLKKTINGKPIIKGLTFDIKRGEVFGFLGPNGAGKTTTIRLMLGLMEMTEGEVWIEGHSIRTDFKKAIAHVGGIIENPDLYKFMSGYKNLLHFARMVPNVSRKRIDELVKLVGLEDRIHDKVRTYSLGMRQRLGLAQAMLHSPALLIMDEPTNGLDPAGIREIRSYIRKIAEEENIAVVVSSHLLSEIQQMCDRIGIIQSGSLISVESVTDFMKSDDTLLVHIEATPIEKAQEVLQAAFPDQPIQVKMKTIQISLERKDIPRAAAVLIKHDIELYEIHPQTKSLEDVFLEVIGGNGHV